MRDYALKSEVGYKLSHGMWAIGHQCKDCVHASEIKDGLFCSVVRAKVNAHGTCIKHKPSEDKNE